MKYENFKGKTNLIIWVIMVSLLNFCLNDSVCDLELLVLELKQDLEDNNILDCLRKIKPPNGVIETIDQKNKRLAAQWDTECSFESTYDWSTQLKQNYGITTLVDEIGEPVDHNIYDQADMCEIIRAIVKAGLLDGFTSDVTNIPAAALNYIDCPGDQNGVKICAINAISYYKTDMWTIMLDSMNMQINNFPNFIKTNQNSNRKEIVVPDDPGEPIDRVMIDAISKISPSDDELQKLAASSKDFTKVDKKRPSDPWKRVYVRYSNVDKEIIVANAGWNFFKSGKLEFDSNSNFFVIAYTMISGYAPNSRLAVRMVLDDVNQISTRMIQGYINYPSLTTGFISQLEAGTHKIQIQYRVSNVLSLDTENKAKENIISGLIVIPLGKLFMKKIINPMEFELFNDNNWADFPNLSAIIKLPKTSYVFIIYNLSMPGMQSHIVTRVDINTQSVFQSRAIAGDSMYWGIHNSFVHKFYADVEYSIKVKYRTPYASKSNPRLNDWEAQSLMLIELPEWVDLRTIIIEEEFNLNCSGVWSVLPKMDIDLELEEDKTIIFIYNVVLPLVNNEMTIGIFLNSLLEHKSVLTYSNTMYFKALGYYPITLTKGKYKIQLKYMTNACVSYKPQTDWQNISLTVLDMN